MASGAKLCGVGIAPAAAAVLETPHSTNNVNDTIPTLAEATTAFGSPSSHEPGKIFTINDNAGGTNFYVIATDGSNYFGLKFTKLS